MKTLNMKTRNIKTRDMKTRNSKASKVKLASLAIGVFFCTIYFISGSLINKAWTASTTTTTGETTKEQKVSNRITGVKWQAQYRLDENKDSYLQERFDFADELLQQNSVTDVTYEFDGNGDGNSDEKKGIEKWFIYSVATDVSGAKLSSNQCASLFSHNVTKCVMVGLKPKAVQWWKNNMDILPSNAFVYDASHVYEWAYEWNQKENFRWALERYLITPNGSFDNQYRNIQAVVLARTLIFVDMLHHGINVWMIDSDVIFPLDPRRMFLEPNYDCVYMINIGRFNRNVRYEVPYSYPFLIDGRHATMNNGIVASRATEASLKLWQWSFDRVLNHASGDPQHPHNQLLFLLGLTLTKVPVAGYPDLEGDFGYYEGNATLHVRKNDTLSLNVRGVSTASAYNKVSKEVLLQQVAIHAVGVGGMGQRQGIKCKYFKSIGFWKSDASCDDN